MLVGILQYPGCNFGSVQNALTYEGITSVVVSKENIHDATALIIPGVGNYGALSDHFNRLGLREKILNYIETGRPLVGICAGMQYMLEGSEEGVDKGLGIFEGRARKFSQKSFDAYPPQIGWAALDARGGSTFSEYEGEFFYFSHSYALPAAESGKTEATYTPSSRGVEVAAILRTDNCFGLQFHPEKSAHQGLKLLKRIVLNEI